MGVMDYDLEEAEFARMVLSRGQRSLVITDHSKFGRLGLVQVCGFDGFSELATDRSPSRDIAAALSQAGARPSIGGDAAVISIRRLEVVGPSAIVIVARSE